MNGAGGAVLPAMPHLALPTLFTIGSTAFFLVLERFRPGRELPHVPGWYARALAVNGAQMLITLGLNRLWNHWFAAHSLGVLRGLHAPALQGFLAWLIGTFFFYWWHRLRHRNGFWPIFHQVHHPPARIEVVTSFYKHPVEIMRDALLGALVLYPLLGVSLQGAFWNNFFAATYKDTDEFAPRCGFPRGNERHLADMLVFRDVYAR